MGFCSNCGSKLIQTAKFCTACGASINLSKNNDPIDQNLPASPLPDTNLNIRPRSKHKTFALSPVERNTLNKKKKALIGFLGVVILFTCYITFMSISNIPTTPEKKELSDEEKNLIRFKNILPLIEKEAIINEKISEGLLKELHVFIKSNGYKCDTVSAARPFMNEKGYKIHCNNYRYEYEIQDKGGNIDIVVK